MSMSCAIAKFDTMLWGLMRRAFTLFHALLEHDSGNDVDNDDDDDRPPEGMARPM